MIVLISCPVTTYLSGPIHPMALSKKASLVHDGAGDGRILASGGPLVVDVERPGEI